MPLFYLVDRKRARFMKIWLDFAEIAKLHSSVNSSVSNSLTMERTRTPRTNVRVSCLVNLPEIPRGIEVVVMPEMSRCPIFGPPHLDIPRVVILEDVEDDMPPMEDEEPAEVRPRSLGRAGRLLQAMRRACLLYTSPSPRDS